MSTTSKSPRKVLLTAHAAAKEALPEYAHRNSPKTFTQHQLFACLALKAFHKVDYRGIEAILEDSPALREAIGNLDGVNGPDLAVANHDSDHVSVLLNLCDSCPADFDGDGTVGASDLAQLLGAWGPCADCENCPTDFDGDCTVTAADLALLLGSWGACS